MPEIVVHMDALSQNLSIIAEKTRLWGVRYLPVLKMVASHRRIVELLRGQGFAAYGTADLQETSDSGACETPPADRVFINLTPLSRAMDVARNFGRSCISSEAAFHAVHAAAQRLRLRHGVLLMADMGDRREGLSPGGCVALAKRLSSVSRQSLEGYGAHVAGLGVTMGCLLGAEPGASLPRQLSALAEAVAKGLGHRLETVSVGGSIFWNFFVKRQGCADIRLPSGCILELRMGDPLLLGRDMYRNGPLLGGMFRADGFSVAAEVVEDRWCAARPCGKAPGAGDVPCAPVRGRYRQMLLDCGTLHADPKELRMRLPGAQVLGACAHYMAVDVTHCACVPGLGEKVSFAPSYWAVAGMFRCAHVRKVFVDAM